MDSSASKAVPITILTGFLGAGKTTLLNRILKGDHGLRAAVLVNDFGAINVDAELIVGVKDGVVGLANGCICCSIRGDLVETVIQTINRPESPDYILLEASGVADPSGIARAFVNPKLRHRIRLDSVNCVIDADQVFAHPEYPELEELQLRQIGFSDLVILNKVDLAGPEKVKKIRQWIDNEFRQRRVIETNYCDAPLEILLSVGRFDPAQAELDGHADTHIHADYRNSAYAHEHRGHDHSNVFSTWSYETDRPMSLKLLRETAGKLPSGVYRAKGVVFSSDAPNRRAVLQVVGRRVDISVQEEWDNRTPRTQIVVIGASGSFDARLMEMVFASCISSANAGPNA
jgi:G3E family GTPase